MRCFLRKKFVIFLCLLLLFNIGAIVFSYAVNFMIPQTRVLWKSNEINYRIPGMISLSSGKVIAYCEERKDESDWADINIVYKISEDGGITWSKSQCLVNGMESHLTVNNPVMVQYRFGDVFCFYEIEYGIEELGGGVFYKKSLDEGKTWGNSVNISSEIGTEDFNCFATGPGHGICSSNGVLISPVWLVLKESNAELQSHHPAVVSTLYSIDDGISWKLGEYLTAANGVEDPNESCIVELSDGTFLINSRNDSDEKYRAVAFSSTGYSHWSEYQFDRQLNDPICFGSICRYDDKSLLFINCDSSDIREKCTCRISKDDGKTWNDGSVLYMQNCGYSDLCVVNKYTYFHKKNILVLTEIKKPDENYYLSLKNISEKYIGE